MPPCPRQPRFRLVVTVLLGLSLLMAAARLHTLEEPLEFDTALYAVFGHELLAGKSLYSDLWDNKPPAIYMTYAAAERLVGYGPKEIYLLSVVAAIATLVGVYAAGSALTGAAAPGLWAALFWALIWADPGLEANQPNTEVFVNACLIWAFALMVRGNSRTAGWGRWLLVGALFALSLLYKPVVMATPLLLAGSYLAFAPDRRRALGQIGVVAAAAAAVGLTVCAYFLAAGRFGIFYDTMVVNNRFYAGSLTANLLQGWSSNFLFPDCLKPAAPLAILGAFGLALGLLKKERRPWVLLAGWVIGTEIAICLPGRFFRHYYQFWLPPLAVATGWALGGLGELAKKDRGSRAYPWLPLITGTAALLILMAYELPLYRLSADQWSQWKYGEHYLVIRNMGLELGQVLHPDETFYQWGIEDGLYFYSRRRPASGIIFLWPVLSGPLAPALQARLLRDLERTPPEIFITKGEQISQEEQRRNPVVAWFLTRYKFWCQRGPFLLYVRPGGRLAAGMPSGADSPRN